MVHRARCRKRIGVLHPQRRSADRAGMLLPLARHLPQPVELLLHLIVSIPTRRRIVRRREIPIALAIVSQVNFVTPLTKAVMLKSQ